MNNPVAAALLAALQSQGQGGPSIRDSIGPAVDRTMMMHMGESLPQDMAGMGSMGEDETGEMGGEMGMEMMGPPGPRPHTIPEPIPASEVADAWAARREGEIGPYLTALKLANFADLYTTENGLEAGGVEGNPNPLMQSTLGRRMGKGMMEAMAEYVLRNRPTRKTGKKIVASAAALTGLVALNNELARRKMRGRDGGGGATGGR